MCMHFSYFCNRLFLYYAYMKIVIIYKTYQKMNNHILKISYYLQIKRMNITKSLVY